MLNQLSVRLVEEIQVQRELLSAENGDLISKPELISSTQILRNVIALFQNQTIGIDHHLKIETRSAELSFRSDPVLVRRILGNMVKNALEASLYQETVTLGCERNEIYIKFTVHNPGVIPPDVQLQIFQRSFSTKGTGRGLGTYGMKLLMERYLGGKVDFVSMEQKGTIFSASFPCEQEA